MAEYIDREAALTAIKVHCPAKYETAILARIVCIPAADVVEVVRCGECEWWTKQEASCQGRCARYGFYPTAAWYCAAGAKMEGDGE